ncbi:hypothetical protein GCM10007860_09540 [Chitiniphilus shinanonensis]|uniref:Uncharacterized protein n=1 Tax=Chitiniphilus shinanonensis TaxID=553088 RepID=A0ABQ6BQ78_9NEIS|nr:hypothetical protein GCM10007860_09540 [Chitiniphilus shinanonensis]
MGILSGVKDRYRIDVPGWKKWMAIPGCMQLNLAGDRAIGVPGGDRNGKGRITI